MGEGREEPSARDGMGWDGMIRAGDRMVSAGHQAVVSTRRAQREPVGAGEQNGV